MRNDVAPALTADVVEKTAVVVVGERGYVKAPDPVRSQNLQGPAPSAPACSR